MAGTTWPRAWQRIGGAGVVGALLLAAVSVAAGGTRPAGAAPRWDPRVAPIARQVEKLRHLEFDHPIPTRFLSDRAFRKLVTSSDSSPGPRSARVAEAQLRALGLVGGSFNLHRTVDDVNGSDILAFYDSDEKRIVVRGTKFDPELRLTLAHELTHGLQDQHYDLNSLEDGTHTSGADDALTAVIEGDAMRIEDAYYRRMSAADQRAVDAAESAGAAPGTAGAGPVNPDEAAAGNSFVTAQLDAPYSTGPAMVAAILAHGHRAGLARAFTVPPTTQLQMLAPALATTKVQPAALDGPKLRAGARRLRAGRTDFGALDLFFLLSSRLPEPVAAQAADAWGNGRVLVSRGRDGRTCTQIGFAGRSPSGARRIADALRSWSAAMPAGAVELSRSGRELRVCDPGAAATAPPNSAGTALDFAGERALLQASMVQGGVPPKAAVCLTDHAVARTDYDQFVEVALRTADPSKEQLASFDRILGELARSCPG
jgi:hypothetical protein